MSHRAEISFFMASSRLTARHARETCGRLAPAAHFAKFESRRDGRCAVTGGSGDSSSSILGEQTSFKFSQRDPEFERILERTRRGMPEPLHLNCNRKRQDAAAKLGNGGLDE